MLHGFHLVVLEIVQPSIPNTFPRGRFILCSNGSWCWLGLRKYSRFNVVLAHSFRPAGLTSLTMIGSGGWAVAVWSLCWLDTGALICTPLASAGRGSRRSFVRPFSNSWFFIVGYAGSGDVVCVVLQGAWKWESIDQLRELAVRLGVIVWWCPRGIFFESSFE